MQQLTEQQNQVLEIITSYIERFGCPPPPISPEYPAKTTARYEA